MDREFVRATLGHRGWLIALARRWTRSRLEAEDAVQETYLQALRGWRRQRPEQVRPWLVTILRNVVRSQYRQRLRRPAEELAASPGAALHAAGDTAEEAMSRLAGAAVRTALRQLPPAQREAVVLMDLYGFTAAAVAELLGAPRGTVLSRVHRGHRRLAELLGPQRDGLPAATPVGSPGRGSSRGCSDPAAPR